MNRALPLLLCALAAAGLALWQRVRSRRTLKRLLGLLHCAASGQAIEVRFDESMLSAVEAAFFRHVQAARSVERQLAVEKERVNALISDISHQTKTPLANVLLYSQLLAEQPALPAQCRELAGQIAQQADKLDFLVGALVKTSRLEAGMIAVRPERGDLFELMEAVRGQLSAAAGGKGVELSVRPSQAWAWFDPKWTAEALGNLVDNAVKYTPSGGRVCLSATAYELFCRVDVEDTGMGIAEEEQALIFQRFYRSPAVSRQPGVGIGLTLSRKIAEAQGGYLKVRSAPGQGATFSLFLPRDPGGAARFLQNR